MTTQAAFCQGPDWRPRKRATEPGTCGACGKPLEGRNTWFCRSRPGEAFSSDGHEGESCRARYMRNHRWGEARAAAIRRDGSRCRRCGVAVIDSNHELEVNHRVPRNGRGYGIGCWNHQDAIAWDFALVVKLNIGREGQCPGGILLQKTKSGVALPTENRPDNAVAVVMIYVRDDFLEATFADGTRIPLGLQQIPILHSAELIDQPQVCGFGGTLSRTIKRITSSETATATEQAGHRLLTPLTPITRFASLTTIEPMGAEGTETLKASPSRNGVPTERGHSFATEAHVMGLTEGVALPHGQSLAAFDSAVWRVVHNIIIHQLPLQHMPLAKPSLETLCLKCHVETTKKQRWGEETPKERAARRRHEADLVRLARWSGQAVEGRPVSTPSG